MGSSETLLNLLKKILVGRLHSQDVYKTSYRLLKHRVYILVCLLHCASSELLRNVVYSSSTVLKRMRSGWEVLKLFRNISITSSCVDKWWEVCGIFWKTCQLPYKCLSSPLEIRQKSCRLCIESWHCWMNLHYTADLQRPHYIFGRFVSKFLPWSGAPSPGGHGRNPDKNLPGL